MVTTGFLPSSLLFCVVVIVTALMSVIVIGTTNATMIRTFTNVIHLIIVRGGCLLSVLLLLLLKLSAVLASMPKPADHDLAATPKGCKPKQSWNWAETLEHSRDVLQYASFILLRARAMHARVSNVPEQTSSRRQKRDVCSRVLTVWTERKKVSQT